MANFLDIFNDETRKGRKIPKEQYLQSGLYPIVDQGQKHIAGFSDNRDGIFTDVPAIIFGDHTRVFKYIDTPFFLGADGVKLLRPKSNDNDVKYLYYALCAARIPDTGYNRHFKWLKLSDIPLPPLLEQQHIAAVLDKISSIIATRRRQLEKFDELVKSQFVEMFGDPATNNNKWDVVPIGALFQVGSSKRIYQSEQTNSGVPFLRIADLMARIQNIETKSNLFISETTYNALNNKGFVPSVGDILVTARGTLGMCYQIKASDKFYFQDGMISWLSKMSNRLESEYILQLFQMPGFRLQIDELQSGSTVNYLSIDMLKRIRAMVPPLPLQKKFADFVSHVDKSKFAARASLEKMTTLKAALMQRYFSA